MWPSGIPNESLLLAHVVMVATVFAVWFVCLFVFAFLFAATTVTVEITNLLEGNSI
jgi:uncharacterized membrane protein YjfL (UPF0719 family)